MIDPQSENKLFDLRQALADAIADAGIFRPDEIIIKRQTDLFNDIATALSTATNGVCLHIGVAEGKPTEDADLEYEMTIPLTIIAEPQIAEGKKPEEVIWQALVKFVHGRKVSEGDHYDYRFRAGPFQDLAVNDDNGSAYLGRQTVFFYKLSL